MAIQFECPKCGSQMAARDDYAGKEGKCKCGTPLIVPGSEKMKFACVHCGKGISVSAAQAGKQGRCPACKDLITVPMPGILVSPQVSPAPVIAKPAQPLAAAAPVPTPAPATILVTCLICNSQIKAKQASAGKIISCPKCGCCLEVPDKSGASTAAPAAPKPAAPSTTTLCPSCDRKLPGAVPVCTHCGIYIKSGRPILTACDVDTEEFEQKAEGIVGAVSWLIPFGIYPVYSEALGNHKPWSTWGIFAATVLVSIWFSVLEISGSSKMMAYKNLLLWNNSDQLEPERIVDFYEYTPYGDQAAFNAKRDELQQTTPEDQLDVAAYKALDSRQRCFGEFRPYQLITHAFLHGGLMHLAGNMLFLIVLGSRVNSAIGNIWMVVLYPILAVVAAVSHMLSMGLQPPTPMLGASGAVMGLAGAYLMLFPVHKIYMVIWMRWGPLAGFHFSFKCFAVRGFWVVLFYIMFDFLAVGLMLDDGTAHWAHIGGLMWGLLLAFVLLAARLTWSGGDIVSIILGKHAWKFIGTPASRFKDAD